ncbi:carbonic anhydrase family protein [Nocardioides nanhaiensis]|uniref:carbonic anhydrase n=1 Tax=Nocardioides nanhaiensis TaxID=1476871 RepID=A0ABP8WQC0_9ACTN
MPTTRRTLLGAPLAATAAAAVSSTVPPTAASAVAARPHQSPIDVRPGLVRHRDDLDPLVLRYRRHVPVSVRYVTRDDPDGGGCQARGAEETEEVDVPEDAGHALYRGERYRLAQFHFHTPSEHTVRGRHAPLEMHLVHQSEAGLRLVVGVLLLPGAPSEADRILRRLPQECDEPIEVDDFDLRSLVPARPRTLRYRGSLTTEPYTEPVLWFLTEPQTCSRAGIRAFQATFPDGDSRDTQPLNGRVLRADTGWAADLRRRPTGAAD